jgi:hypothetical protein
MNTEANACGWRSASQRDKYWRVPVIVRGVIARCVVSHKEGLAE